MKKISVFLIFTILILSCRNTKNTTKASNQISKENVLSDKQNDDQFSGFKFNLPQNWQKSLSNFKAVDLNGQVKTVETDYQLNKNDQLRLIFHPGKAGIEIFTSYENSRRKNIFHTNINKMRAVKMIEWMSKDGKGHLLPQPMTRTRIFVLHPKEKGCLEIVFDLKEKNQKAKSEFESFLKSLKPAL